jgi:glycerol uptake facilitator-like aquaporin
MSYTVKLFAGFVGTALLVIFVLGLSKSISSGFAGFWGGFPFMIISIAVLSMAAYDFWDECIRRKK